MAAPYRRVGRIVKPHGTHGEVAVSLERGVAPDILAHADVWIVPPVGTPHPYAVLEEREGSRGPLIRLSGVDDAAAAHALTGRWLLAHGESLPEPDTLEDDLVGYRVTDGERGDLGTVTGIIVTGANDVLVVSGDRYGEVLIPVIDDVMVRVDSGQQVVEVRLLDGLIEEDS